MNRQTILIIITTILFTASQASIGVSTSPYTTNYTTSNFKCIFNQGYRDVTFSLLQSAEGIQPEHLKSLINIKNAGCLVNISFIGCARLNAFAQAEDFMKKVDKTLFDIVWIQLSDNIEDIQCSWLPALTKPTQPQENCQLLKSLVDEFKQRGVKTGIATNENQWNFYFAGRCEMSSEPLYWFEEDEVPSFYGFRPFGGWKIPAAKQYVLIGKYVGQPLIFIFNRHEIGIKYPILQINLKFMVSVHQGKLLFI